MKSKEDPTSEINSPGTDPFANGRDVSEGKPGGGVGGAMEEGEVDSGGVEEREEVGVEAIEEGEKGVVDVEVEEEDS